MNAERDSPKFSQEVLSGELYGVHRNIVTAFSWAFSYDHPARGEYISMTSGLLELITAGSAFSAAVSGCHIPGDTVKHGLWIIEFRLLPSETQPTLLINLQGCDGSIVATSEDAVLGNDLFASIVPHQPWERIVMASAISRLVDANPFSFIFLPRVRAVNSSTQC
ncbi:hypothetical protein JEQ12_001565 [Ovis aries]|uniref:Uncharacterized protein n=1 Tax=Ovis aries TaxID=9940 RepID=A0A836D8N2_SHEEP|nr:hypothetical protein JEQ12_001565 [Ovis aries]